jgi:hypothetical protein
MHRIEIEQTPDHHISALIAQRLRRSSSFRTIARTGRPCFNSSSVIVRPTPPIRPAAPVTKMGFAMFFLLFV